MSGFWAPAILAAIVSRAQIKARTRDGENPANHTKPTRAEIRRKKVSLRTPVRLPKKSAMAENMERCIPERAKMWERPARRKASEVAASVYSRAPHKSARRRPPPLPQAYIRRLKCRRQRARKRRRRPRHVEGQKAVVHWRT